MKTLSRLIAFLIIAIGVTSILVPDVPLSLRSLVATQAGLMVIAIVRVAIGVVLIWTAPTSRTPRTLQVVGAVVLGAGLATPLFGVERTKAVLDWEAAQGPMLIRAGGAVALAIGGFLTFALTSRKGGQPA